MNLPNSVHNRLSYAGAVIAGLALIVFGFLFFLHSVTDTARAPYASLLIFVLVPAVLVFGLALIPLGMLRERRHVRRTGEQSIPRLPVLDMNDPRQRNMVVIVAIGSVFLLFLTVFGSFQAYEATESVAFCGATCHTVMAPEYVTYQSSPHARVKCVECHVGPGAEWYVKSKMSGLYQVYAVLFDKYPRPITGPISSLRPAQETCEQCHWPDHFFQAQQRRIDHFLPDEQNTRWEIDLLIKTGGGKPGALETGGVHRDGRTAPTNPVGSDDRSYDRQGHRVHVDGESPVQGGHRTRRPSQDGLYGLPQPSQPHLSLARRIHQPGTGRR